MATPVSKPKNEGSLGFLVLTLLGICALTLLLVMQFIQYFERVPK